MRKPWLACGVIVILTTAGCAPRQPLAAPRVAQASSPVIARAKHHYLLRSKLVSNAAAARDPALRDLLSAQQALLADHPGAAARAVVLYRRAAERGNAVAQYDLGVCLDVGIGMAADQQQAAFWYGKAAVNRNDPAVRRIAAQSLAALPQTADVAAQ